MLTRVRINIKLQWINLKFKLNLLFEKRLYTIYGWFKKLKLLKFLFIAKEIPGGFSLEYN